MFPTFIRVRDRELTEKTGKPFDLSIVESSFNEEIYERVEGPATYSDGTPLPPSRGDDAEPAGDAPQYERATKADLQAEIDRRNTDRPEGDLIVPSGDTKKDLVAALEADDAS